MISQYQKSQELISKFDKFGSQISLQFQKNQIHQTVFGGVFSILIYSSAIFFTYFFGKELWEKTSPITNTSEEPVFQPEKFEINAQTFSFAFGIQNLNWEHYIDPSIYQVKAFQKTSYKIFNKTTNQYEQVYKNTEIKLVRCKQEHFIIQGVDDYFKNLPFLNDLFCFDPDQQMHIEGDFSSDQFGVIEIYLGACDQEKSNIVCKDKEYINKQLQKSFFASYFTDKLIDPKNYQQPFKYIAKDLFWPISNDMSKSIVLYMRNIYIESDNGLITDNIQYLKDTVYSYQTEQVQSTKESENFFFLLIRFEKGKQSRYYRRYKKPQDILANIAGIVDALILLELQSLCHQMNLI
ncbi:hypothetical protein IMG5_048180 [Ichthyophthirius multifiliis]|uniref:Transmembrane protein n=1 Tax=Ichthyophthirius multifiliis TaxID=5932 RepID=G0QMF0_ICHMU|nr:hypothetical protein IMG5_048180 [Ichthyophthirius multifiliis]EGR33601.1 hypothetical protein IMG5_048180 [Ichthyophthirius multifiliis]|eukprot:XP_004037587.1 hypothetical protein IMG5_048180 [Ichthyophthirius multifiliis]